MSREILFFFDFYKKKGDLLKVTLSTNINQPKLTEK
jgi:hypothetical protein